MSIRWKLLLLLLGIALLPLSVVDWHAQSTIRSLGDKVAGQERETLTRELTERLRVTVEDRADLIRAQKTLVELALERIATEAESRLAMSGPFAAPVYFTRQFDGDGAPPPGIRPSDKHMRIGSGGAPEPKPISLEAVNIVVAPGVAADAVSADIDRMASMLPVYQDLYGKQPDLVVFT